MTAVDCAVQDPERLEGWRGRAIAIRLMLLAIAQAAMVSGSSVIEFGTRNLALHSALSHRTVARVLRLLHDEPDPLIDLVSPRRLARADRYQLRIPARYAGSVRWRRRRAGRIEAIHPVFLVPRRHGRAGVPGAQRGLRTRRRGGKGPHRACCRGLRIRREPTMNRYGLMAQRPLPVPVEPDPRDCITSVVSSLINVK